MINNEESSTKYSTHYLMAGLLVFVVIAVLLVIFSQKLFPTVDPILLVLGSALLPSPIAINSYNRYVDTWRKYASEQYLGMFRACAGENEV